MEQKKKHPEYRNYKYRGKISSVGRALDCRAGGTGFDDSRGRTITQGLKITEK